MTLDIKQAISQAKREFNEPGYLIKRGNCDQFAIRVIDLLGGYSDDLTDGAPDDMDCELPGHYWIEYKDKYYDAECSKGVTDWHSLPLFKRYSLTNKGNN